MAQNKKNNKSKDEKIDKYELIKIEMELLQSRFDKYDDFILRSRNWFME